MPYTSAFALWMATIPVYGVEAEAHTGEQQQRLLFNPKVSGLLVCSPYWNPFSVVLVGQVPLRGGGAYRIRTGDDLIGNQGCYRYTNAPYRPPKTHHVSHSMATNS